MNELYSFDKVGEFSVVVEFVGEEGYEGSVFLYAAQNPHAVDQGRDGEEVREKLLQVASEICSD